MRYKALMLDVDGTLVPYDYQAVPSDVVADAISLAKKKVTVCLVTGRSYGFTQPILEKLKLDIGYVVVNNGAQVINLSTKQLLYDQQIAVDDATYIAKVLLKEHIPFFLKQKVFGLTYQKTFFKFGEPITTPYMFFTEERYTEERADGILKQLSHLPHISAYKGHHKNPQLYGLSICHVNATKLHGVNVLIEKLHLKKEEIIGVGDSYNDFPLLMASGLKVAMGNAVDDLKAIADYVAPSVQEDGVADVIRKYVI